MWSETESSLGLRLQGPFLRSEPRFADNELVVRHSVLLRPADEEEHERVSDPPAAQSSELNSDVRASLDVLDFDSVYRDNFGFVWRVAKRKGVAEEHLDDVCQEVFIIVHRKLPGFEQRAKVRTWIYQIISNVVRNQRRSVQRKSVHAQSRGAVIDPEELDDAQAISPEASTRRKEAAQVAREILMEMSEKHRMVFVLVELEGMGLKEVAEATGESFHTIRSRLRAARTEFQRHARRVRNVSEWGGGHG